MDVISLGCSVVASYPVEVAMKVFNLLGHGYFGGGIAVLLIGYGVVFKNHRVRQVGLAALLAVVAAGILADLLKHVFRDPGPRSLIYRFPSGHTSSAFAVAGALGWAFPSVAPFVDLFALLAGLARLYYFSHFVVDMIGGIVLGTGLGIFFSRRLVSPAAATANRRRTRWAWVVLVLIGVPAVAFFMNLERTIVAQRPLGASPAADSPAQLAIKFGTPDARTLLLEGWSEDEMWDGEIPFVWAVGPESQLGIPSLPPADYRVRLRLHPVGGHSCQTMWVTLNGVPAARFLLERGWSEYETKLPKSLSAVGPNEVRFRFSYGEVPREKGRRQDDRRLSVAFASVSIFVDGQPKWLEGKTPSGR